MSAGGEFSGRNRVVITGVGTVSAAGLGTQAAWIAARDAAKPFVLPTRSRNRPLNINLVAEVPPIDVEGLIERKRLSGMDPVSQMGVIAAREAVEQSGLEFANIDAERVQCIVGTGAGGQVTQDDMSERVYAGGADKVHPLTVPRTMVSAVASHIAMEYGIHGGVYVVSSACASATHAIGLGFQAIRSGTADVVLCGGSEMCLSYGCLKAWDALHVVTDDLCRPFSAGRRGLMLGEGAAIFVLESYDKAKARGADILAEVKGFGMSSDAGTLTSPDVNGMARAMRWALADAAIAPDTVDHVNAHGTGTQLNDVTECAALQLIFGDRASQIPVTATKSVLGHALGASGALELAIAVMTLRDKVIAPTANFVSADNDCPIDCIPNEARDFAAQTILSNSFAFGGLNASLVVGHA